MNNTQIWSQLILRGRLRECGISGHSRLLNYRRKYSHSRDRLGRPVSCSTVSNDDRYLGLGFPRPSYSWPHLVIENVGTFFYVAIVLNSVGIGVSKSLTSLNKLAYHETKSVETLKMKCERINVTFVYMDGE